MSCGINMSSDSGTRHTLDLQYHIPGSGNFIHLRVCDMRGSAANLHTFTVLHN